MDKAIFQFSADGTYTKESVKHFTREMCERFSNIDEDNVTKYVFENDDELEEILNGDFYSELDTENSWYKVFVTE